MNHCVSAYGGEDEPGKHQVEQLKQAGGIDAVVSSDIPQAMRLIQTRRKDNLPQARVPEAFLPIVAAQEMRG